MNSFVRITTVAAALLAGTGACLAANPMVGGAAMYPSKNIVQNAVNSADHTTLVAAVKAAGLVDTLEGPGPFTVFAPNNRAFAALPAGTVDTLLEPAEEGDADLDPHLPRGAGRPDHRGPEAEGRRRWAGTTR